MAEHTPTISQDELRPLLELAQRIGSDPLLTQGRTGSIPAKLDGVLWIQAPGKWMAHAMRDDILIPLGSDLAIPSRRAHPTDYVALMEISRDSPWDLPDDDVVHALSTDVISQAILAAGLLYPCQAIFSDSRTSELFGPVPSSKPGDHWRSRYANRPFLHVERRGVIVSRSIGSLTKGEVGIREKKREAPLGEFIESDVKPYVENRFADKPKTLEYYRAGLKLLASYQPLQGCVLGSITADKVAGYVAKLRDSEHAVATINRRLDVYVAF